MLAAALAFALVATPPELDLHEPHDAGRVDEDRARAIVLAFDVRILRSFDAPGTAASFSAMILLTLRPEAWSRTPVVRASPTIPAPRELLHRVDIRRAAALAEVLR